MNQQDTFYQMLDQIDVFSLLGMQGTEEEKMAFLQEMQQTIWSQVVEDEILPTLSQEQITEVEDIMADTSVPLEESQAKVLEFLTRTTPNLPELLKNKILEFKASILVSRIGSLREKYATSPAQLQTLDSVESMLEQGSVQQAVQALSTL